MHAGTLVLGAGPAGLTAAYLLAQAGRRVTVLESEAVVGGLSRTEIRDGYRFDLGGHRFFTKSPEVEQLWHEILGENLLRCPRRSRIYYDSRFIEYPLEVADVVRKLGPVELLRVLVSYARAVARRNPPEENFEQWVSNRFGARLYEMFFRSYTEKVWGVSCTELRAEWAAQRIRGLSLPVAAQSALFRSRKNEVKTLITSFYYPRLGPGQMWEAMAERCRDLGVRIVTETPVESLEIQDGRLNMVVAGGTEYRAEDVISSLPLPTVTSRAAPSVPSDVRVAGERLRYRDFLTVALVIQGEDPFPDNWIYVHDQNVRVARIQNYRAWSPWMVPVPETSCLGLEYFCFEGDALWSESDDALIDIATRELGLIGLVDVNQVSRGYVVRVPRAYPIYDAQYGAHVDRIRRWLEGIDNLQQVGRNGLHRYNNSDHSMLTAIRAVENLGGANHDLWDVNADSWYHEEQKVVEHPYRPHPSRTRA